MNKLLALSVLFYFAQFTSSVVGAEFAAKAIDKEPPAEIDASIRKVLQTKAVQVSDGEKPAFEFWFTTELPLPSKPESAGKGLDAIKQATLLGAVVVHGGKRDYKDNDLPAGAYTMRFALQPQDGNHLGTSEFQYFAVLIRAKNDPKLDGISEYKALVKASSKETTSDHPIILSLRPVGSADGSFPSVSEPAPEHKSVRVKVPASTSGAGEKTSVVFDLVFKGVGKI